MNRALGEDKIKVGITLGDINGVGPEVIVRTFTEPTLLELFTPVVYGSGKALSFYKKLLEAETFSYTTVRGAEEAQLKKLNVVNCWEEDVKVEPGISNDTGAKYAVKSLEAATNDLIAGKVHCLVTAPIDKSHMAAAGFDFPGHTEYLAQRAGGEALMLMVHENLRVALVTGHIGLAEVSATLTSDKILQKIKLLNDSLIRDFNVRRPKIAVLALNPHAGDGGKFGTEESDIIAPAIQKAFGTGILAAGPFPADGFFAAGTFEHYDAVLAMYHDQGLIPFKTISMIGGVNYTAGLNIVRTSPDHGAAFNIAGKNKASEVSFREALYLACDIYTTRKNNKDLQKNPLRRLSKDLDDREDE